MKGPPRFGLPPIGVWTTPFWTNDIWTEVSFGLTPTNQRDNDSSPNFSFNYLKQKEIEIKEGSARVLWYETQLLIGQLNGGNPKFQEVSPKLFFSQIIR